MKARPDLAYANGPDVRDKTPQVNCNAKVLSKWPLAQIWHDLITCDQSWRRNLVPEIRDSFDSRDFCFQRRKLSLQFFPK